MTLTELSYIVALAREQHFGRAAERCHVSQIYGRLIVLPMRAAYHVASLQPMLNP
jgi:hypothetical protein